jgi:hypothetical protein
VKYLNIFRPVLYGSVCERLAGRVEPLLMAARELPSGIVLMWKKCQYPEILRILTLF